ncbi:MAG: hypothetical protein A2Y60_01055 [Chloroflexi bacterium RBG_13_54_9]|nr:MAG: hypothetical protein A2Y60_01055 [Chloroflexi bacterium RBG_13_54_9]
MIMPLLPFRVGYSVAVFFGDLAYFTARRSRRAVTQNIGKALGPEASNGKLNKTVHSVFRNAAKNYFDLLRIPAVDLGHLDGNLAIHGWRYFEEAKSEGKGVILVTAHLGNFDLVAQILAARNVGLTVLAEPLQPTCLFRFVTKLRESKGLTFLPIGLPALKATLRSLRSGGVVAVACDRDILRNGLALPFFGEETSFPIGAVELALRTGAAIVPAFSVRRANDRFDVYVEPPLPITVAGDHEQNVRQNLSKVITAMEKYIRCHPDQWVVFNPVWMKGKEVMP